MSPQRRVDAACDRFEEAWRAGRTPRIEDVLAGWPGPERSELLRELLALELELRRRQGERPQPGEYRLRFPADAGLVDAVFEMASTLTTLTAASTPAPLGETLDPTPPAADDRVPPDAGIGKTVDLAPSVPGTIAPAGPPEAPGDPDRGADYELLEVLGRGGMGVVYKARRRGLNRLVALKMIRHGGTPGSEQHARFRIEAEAVARLRHPNIVQIYDVGDYNGMPFASLELLEGGTLAGRLAATPQPGRASAEMMVVLAMAMEAAHRAGIVHRDLKPSNVLLDADGTPKITDFGLAKRLELDEGLSETGQVMGTPSYMAPEQARGEVRAIGPATDVYALGAILYEMLTGRPPFKGPTSLDTLRQVDCDEPVPPSRLQPTVPRDLETICLKCLAKAPERRYASAQALADDLGRFLRGEPIRARRTPAWERGVKWARRRPATATLLALGFLVAGASEGIWLRYSAARREQQRRDDVRAADARIREDLRVAELRRRTDQGVFEGQGLVARGKWTDAKQLLSNVLTEIKDEPRLEDLRGRAAGLLAQADGGLAEQQTRDGDQGRLRRFREMRHEALFHETRFTGLDLPSNQEAVRRSVGSALAMFDTPGPDETWDPAPLPASLSERERSEIDEGRYELLLVLAEEAPRAERGLRILEQAARRHPPTRAYHLRRAACLSRAGDAAGAARASSEAERLVPASATDHFLIGLARYKRGQWEAALRDLDAALLLRPDHFWAHCLSAICSLNLQRPAEAKGRLTACLQAEPGFAWLYILRGFASCQVAVSSRDAAAKPGVAGDTTEAGIAAQFQAAEADYRKALELLDRTSNDELRYVLLVNRGLMGLQRRRWAEAEADLRRAVRLDGRSFQAYAALAQVAQRRGNPEAAAEEFGRAIALRPDWAPLYRGRADVYLDRLADATPAQRSQAMRDLEQAIRLEAPTNPVLARDHTNRARLLNREHRQDETLAACDAALAVVPDYADAHRLRIAALLDAKRYDQVVRSCDAVLARGPASADLYELRGLARAALKDIPGAIADATQALALRPDSPRLLARRGWLHLHSEAPRPALRDFEEAIRLDPSGGDAYAGRGTARVRLGQHREAVRDAEEAVRHGGPAAWEAYAAARIYALASSVAASDVARNGRDAVLLTAKYRDRAVALAREAMERTPVERRAAFRRDVLQTDQALRAIRRRLDYPGPAARATASVR